ncbi:MAG TPA: tRNA glutamyl-Q(34) synthetase GluQRS [Gammaproteobacteria bacterium]
MGYVGRFAPSPTGPLHIGSLTTAVASWLHARQRGGEWLVRVEDIDPPREQPGAAAAILQTLDAFGLHWDREVLFQSSRLAAYEEAVGRLLDHGLAFHCSCTRSEVRAVAGEHAPYPGTCRTRRQHRRATAVRARVEPGVVRFDDGVQGAVENRLDRTLGDYVIRRRDGLPAYHLAVVIDDAAQGVTDVVRGVDLLESTAAHIHLQRALRLPAPRYWHLPVVVDATGAKLSKQTGARGLTAADPAAAVEALRYLGLDVPPELEGERPEVLWQWALPRWRIEALAHATRVVCAGKGGG